MRLFDGEDPSKFEGKSNEEIMNFTQQEIQKYDDDIHAKRPLWILKTFHPTPEGLKRTAEIVLVPKLYARLAHRKLPPAKIKIMVTGDYTPYDSQDPQSDIYQGFMRHFAALLENCRMYGALPGDQVPKALFVGSQQPAHTGAFPHEC